MLLDVIVLELLRLKENQEIQFNIHSFKSHKDVPANGLRKKASGHRSPPPNIIECL